MTATFTHLHFLNRLRTCPRAGACPLFLFCLVTALAALCHSLQVVYVSDSDGNSRTLISWAENPQALMRRAGILPGRADRCTYTLYSGTLASLNIQRAFAVTVQADGQCHTAQLCSGTVADALAACGVQLGAEDTATPAPEQPLTAGTAISVQRVTYRERVQYEAIPYESETRYTSLTGGENSPRVLQAGAEGQCAVTLRERLVDGRVTGSEVLCKTVLAEPCTEILLLYTPGTAISAVPGPALQNGVPSRYRAVYTGLATGYSSAGGQGASGLGLFCGSCAVNPALIPYGSKLYIASADGSFVYGYAIATDTGTALQSGRTLVDLYFDSYAESARAGLRQVQVYVIE